MVVGWETLKHGSGETTLLWEGLFPGSVLVLGLGSAIKTSENGEWAMYLHPS